LRDYARIGLFALRGGVLPDGRRVLPGDWMAQSTARSPANPGYGYLWWLGDNGAYGALGIYGQAIWISPADSVVIVTHSVWPRATGHEFSAHRSALFTALTAAVRRNGPG
jgi:CubicO group peptidase (beta-lactamase class C family)